MASKELIIEPFVHIPYEGPEPGDDEMNGSCELTIPVSAEHREQDLACGPRLRAEIFEHVWEEYDGKLREAVEELYAPVVAQALNAVTNAYKDVSPLLLHTELPVVAISGSGRSASQTICASLRRALWSSSFKGLNNRDEENDRMSVDIPAQDANDPAPLICNITASNTFNLVSAMKALVSGFIDNHLLGDEDLAQTRRKVAASSTLAAYDINMLEAWFLHYTASLDLEGQIPPKLVVFINEFEDAEPSVIQDLFYICSLHIPRLPFVFVLAMSSPKEPSFLHATYPRSTLALLQLRRIAPTNESDLLQSILLKLLFDPSFEPTIQLGPATLDFLVEQFNRNSQSAQSLSGILKLILLRHFMTPLTIFAIEESLGEDSLKEASEMLADPSSSGFLELLLARLYHPDKSTLLLPKRTKSWPIGTPQSLLETVRDLRESHFKEARLRRLAFRVLLLVRKFLLDKGLQFGAEGKVLASIPAVMSVCLKGTEGIGRATFNCLATMTKNLPEDQMKELLQELYQLFFNLPRALRGEEADALTPALAKWMARLDHSQVNAQDGQDSLDQDGSGDQGEVGEELSEWLLGYFEEHFQPYTETNLWDVWYTGNPGGITELTSPAPRVNVIGALLQPDRYIDHVASGDRDKQSPQRLSDTSLLFHRYLESGRMINVHDWYESFSGALEADRSNAEREELPSSEKSSHRRGTGRSPSKRKGKGKERAVETPSRKRVNRRRGGDEEDEEMDVESAEGMSEEEWKTMVHVRFLRGVQELDFMGFLKHTRRKAEHVLKTVYDPPE